MANPSAPVCPPLDGIPKQFWMTQALDGTGAFNHIGNYASTPLVVGVTAPSHYEVYSIIVLIADNASFNATDYGGIASGTVTIGPKFYVVLAGSSPGTELPLLSSAPLFQNFQWFTVTEDASLSTFAGTFQCLRVNFKIDEEYGKPLRLNTGDSLRCRLADNFTGLVNQTFAVRGIQYT